MKQILTYCEMLEIRARNDGGPGSGPHEGDGRSYHMVAVHERTGKKTTLSAKPMPHKEANTMRSKFNARPNVRIQLEQA